MKFLGALGFLTRIRVPQSALALPLNSTSHYFPAVGLVVGTAGVLVFLLASTVLPVGIAVILSMISTMLVTGGFHEDGLADTGDGLGGGWTKEDVLRIMQDSRIGSFGLLAIVSTLALKFEALVSIPTDVIPISLLVGHTLSRFWAITLTRTHDYVRFEGKSKPISDGITLQQMVFASLAPITMLCFFPWQLAILILLVTGIVRQYIGYRIKVRIGGYTGDILGATQQLTEVSSYLVICAWMLF